MTGSQGLASPRVAFRAVGVGTILPCRPRKRVRPTEVVPETAVRCTEVDVTDHMNNARYVAYLEWGREE